MANVPLLPQVATSSRRQETMESRSRKILQTALRLAEKGGFSAVRLRDIAAEAGVALGTVYKRFQSKEDILLHALQMEMNDFLSELSDERIEGDSALDRVVAFFSFLTRWLCDRSNLARAVVRSMASGDTSLTRQISSFHGQISALITAAFRGESLSQVTEDSFRPSEQEEILAKLLQPLWFASLVGWSGGLETPEDVIKITAQAARLLLLGLQASASL